MNSSLIDEKQLSTKKINWQNNSNMPKPLKINITPKNDENNYSYNNKLEKTFNSNLSLNNLKNTNNIIKTTSSIDPLNDSNDKNINQPLLLMPKLPNYLLTDTPTESDIEESTTTCSSVADNHSYFDTSQNQFYKWDNNLTNTNSNNKLLNNTFNQENNSINQFLNTKNNNLQNTITPDIWKKETNKITNNNISNKVLKIESDDTKVSSSYVSFFIALILIY